MNRFNAIGRLTKDIEDRVLTNGTQVASFDLAVDSNYSDNDGKFKTNFIRCKAFGNIAKVLIQYTQKGSQIGIEGEIQTGSYTGQDGTKKYTTDILISKIDLLGSKESKESKPQVTNNAKTKNDPYADFGQEISLTEDDLPF